MNTPRRLVIEYEDGSKKGIDFVQLSRRSQFELSKLGLCPPPTVMQLSKNYVLLRWKDGWQEVIGVDKTSLEMLRYYVLERTETVGRMALEAEGDYPELLIINRMPKELDSLLIIGNGKAKAYGFAPKRRNKEGGKIEHVERHFEHEPGKNAGAWVKQIMDFLRMELGKRRISVRKLLAMDQTQRVEEYKSLASELGIRPMDKQEDVYGFIQLMMENLASIREVKTWGTEYS